MKVFRIIFIIQDFESDFLWKVSLKKTELGELYNGFSDLVLIYLNTIDHFNLKWERSGSVVGCLTRDRGAGG